MNHTYLPYWAGTNREFLHIGMRAFLIYMNSCGVDNQTIQRDPGASHTQQQYDHLFFLYRVSNMPYCNRLS